MAIEAGEEARDTKRQETEEKHAIENDLSWNSSFSSAFTLSSSKGSDAAKDSLWAEIELAERRTNTPLGGRYMVSALYEDAAATASTTLQTLSSEMHTNGGFCNMNCSCDGDNLKEEIEGVGNVCKSEYKAMLESAGMVLLQTYHALGRVSDFFDSLKTVGVEVAELPPTLLLAGACLQISAGAFPAARAALEEYLAVRTITNAEDCSDSMTIAVGKNGSVLKASSASGRMRLTAEKYADVAELYVIQVLVKGLSDTKSAFEWVECANITEERRMLMLKKILLHTVSNEAASKSLTNSLPTPVPTVVLSTEEGPRKNQESTDKGDHISVVPRANGSSVRVDSVALLKRLKISEGFFSIKTLLELAVARLNAATSPWRPVSMAGLEGRALSIGALVSLFFFILLRQRHSLRRSAETNLLAIHMDNVGKFWRTRGLSGSMKIPSFIHSCLKGWQLVTVTEIDIKTF